VIQIFRGNGDGTFGPAQYFPTDYGTEGVIVADLNGDGRSDLMNLNVTGVQNLLTIHLNTTPAACTFAIAPSSQPFGPAGGSNGVTVTAPAGCAWTAATNDPGVVTVPPGASGNGPGTVSYTVSTNSGPGRTGKLTIAGQTFTVNQDSGCTFAILPTSANLGLAGGTGSVTVTTGAGCDWTAMSLDTSWLTVTSGASGSGPGAVGCSVAANSGPARSSSIKISGQSFAVSQDGITASPPR
jgi:hypothetical protein